MIFWLLSAVPFQQNFVVMSNGEVIEEDNMHEVQSVASISKIMTALIALENNELGDVVTVDHETTQQTGSSVYLQENQQFTLLSLVYGLMLRSGNDSAYLIALHTSGSIEKFVELMNEKAQEIGMKNTLFRNPSGLDEEDGGNLSTCYDMALLMEEAMKNEIFRIITGSKRYQAENDQLWINKNKLLFDYEFTTGGKTGYTLQSGKTLVTSANSNGLESVVVSFRESEYFHLHQSLHEKTSEKVKCIELLSPGTYQILGKSVIIDQPLIMLSESEIKPIQVHYLKNQICIQYTNYVSDKRVCYSYERSS